METYPSISSYAEKRLQSHCFAFYKYDGSNLRFEWNKKSGWSKFGTRSQLFDESNEEYGPAIAIFREKFSSDLEDIFRSEYPKSRRMTVFCEFFGPNSFVGQHPDGPEDMELKLIDVKVYKKGFVSPKEFVDLFCERLGDRAARLVYEGPLDEDFVRGVQENRYDLNEGVICKGGSGHGIWRCKIKTNAYKDKLAQKYGVKWRDYL